MPLPEPELDLLQAQILVVPLLVACRVSRLPLLYMGFSFVYPPVRVLLSRPNLKRCWIHHADQALLQREQHLAFVGGWRTDIGNIDSFDHFTRIAVRLDLDCFHGGSPPPTLDLALTH